ncbi:MAG: hypothetical protein IJA92_04285, partial [Oscillospiraceae bacterium]|nr:hypothetical protein [Oscillospiraceae bacterium]
MKIVLKMSTAPGMATTHLKHHDCLTHHSPAKKMLSSCSFLSNSILPKKSGELCRIFDFLYFVCEQR